MSSLDVTLVRNLADLHPWTLKKLCQQAGLEATTLSHFFARERPLPVRKAAKFLGLIGLKMEGDFNKSHSFVFQPHFGQEEIAQIIIASLFPTGARRLNLLCDGGCGDALYDGQSTVILHAIQELSPQKVELCPEKFKLVGCNNIAADLLTLDSFPGRTIVQAAFGDF